VSAEASIRVPAKSIQQLAGQISPTLIDAIIEIARVIIDRPGCSLRSGL
jgi:hypothetical protein